MLSKLCDRWFTRHIGSMQQSQKLVRHSGLTPRQEKVKVEIGVGARPRASGEERERPVGRGEAVEEVEEDTHGGSTYEAKGMASGEGLPVVARHLLSMGDTSESIEVEVISMAGGHVMQCSLPLTATAIAIKLNIQDTMAVPTFCQRLAMQQSAGAQ